MGKKRESFIETISSMTSEQRLARAEEVTEKLTNSALYLVDLHEVNSIFSYSNQIANQVSGPYGGNAFNTTREALTHFEVLRTIALWDRPSDGTISIPVVIDLIDSSRVIRLAAKKTFEAHANHGTAFLNPNPDPLIQAEIERLTIEQDLQFARKQRRKCIHSILNLIWVFRNKIWTDKTMESIKNIRHYIAHEIENTDKERRGKPFSAPLWQSIWNLQKFSIHIIEQMYCWINGVYFSIEEDYRRTARNNSEEFLGRAKFA